MDRRDAQFPLKPFCHIFKLLTIYRNKTGDFRVYLCGIHISSYKDIKTLIGHKGEILYGQLPKNAMVSWGLQLSLVPRKSRDQKPLKLDLSPTSRLDIACNQGLIL